MREVCRRTGTVLIFDEVITGFRVGPGGAQGRLGVTPDLTIFGKAVANGFPVAGLAGTASLMDLLRHRQGDARRHLQFAVGRDGGDGRDAQGAEGAGHLRRRSRGRARA